MTRDSTFTFKPELDFGHNSEVGSRLISLGVQRTPRHPQNLRLRTDCEVSLRHLSRKQVPRPRSNLFDGGTR